MDRCRITAARRRGGVRRSVTSASRRRRGQALRPGSLGGPPWPAFRSARNHAHLVADAHGLDLVDVTYTNATTANVLAETQHGAPPQISVMAGSESLVTVTIGGNDVGYHC
jgi:hypothetical protein